MFISIGSITKSTVKRVVYISFILPILKINYKCTPHLGWKNRFTEKKKKKGESDRYNIEVKVKCKSKIQACRYSKLNWTPYPMQTVSLGGGANSYK